ncbi:MAG: hypothetical protein HKO59_15445 [Phycisphaerales bacterium]|nr:hypothetical protein [Phycisphaerae bacterium]NNM27352.1 hypothetical protein [Phycisphaerales bacterium]
MIRRVRRSLARIRYYSATRHRTPVNVALEWALPITMILAPVATLATEALVERSRTVDTVNGRLHRDEDRRVVATIDAPDAPWIEAAPVGEWAVDHTLVHRGWPLVSATRGEEAIIVVNLFDEVGVRTQLAADAPERRAIADTLNAAGHHILATGGRGATLQRHWVGSIATVMLWWVMLFFAAAIAIYAAAFVMLLRRGRRKERAVERASTGRCAKCDYDLRGTEYSARCPECGTLVR